MQSLVICLILAIIAVANARSPQHVGKKLPEQKLRSVPLKLPTIARKFETRQSSRFMTEQTSSQYGHVVLAKRCEALMET